MIGSVFSIPLLLDSVGEENVKDILQTFSCVSEGVQLCSLGNSRAQRR